MKLSRMFAAASLVIASLGVSATADAQGPRGDRHHDDRGPGRGPGFDHGPGPGRGPGFRDDRHHGRHDRDYRNNHRRYGYNGYGNSRCRVVWRNHRQVRVCR